MERKIRVLLVDDQRLFSEALQRLIEHSAPDIEVVGKAVNGSEAIKLTLQLRPDLVLMDIRMPQTDGIEATREIMAKLPKTKVLILTTFDEDEYVFEALRLGATGYLLKDMSTDEVIQGIRLAYEGKSLLAPNVATKVVQVVRKVNAKPAAGSLSDLSAREIEILRLIALCKNNNEIARELHISVGTVCNYISGIYDKLGTHDRVQAALFALEHGLVSWQPAVEQDKTTR